MSSSFPFQESAVALIVTSAFVWLGWTRFMKYFGDSTSVWLLNHGYLKAGFWLKKRSSTSPCSDCTCPPK